MKKIKDTDVYMSIRRYKPNTKIGKYSLDNNSNPKNLNIYKTLFLDVKPTS